MAKRFWRKLAATAKIETTYGTDAVPTGAANAIQLNDVSLTPLAGEEKTRDLLTAYYGHQGVLLVGDYVELQGFVELAGSGTAGTAPAYGPLLRACGLAETTVATTSVTYAPASAGQEALTLYLNLDGVNHVMLGARGTFTLALAPKEIPRLVFTFRGLLGPITALALPTAVLTAFKKPVPVSKANTALWTLHGFAAIAESFSFDLGAQVEARHLVGDESIQITGRQATGTMVVEADTLAAKDWISIARAHTTGALAIRHGLTAGNIIEINAPAVQIGRPTYGNTQGITNYSLPLMFTPVTGDDEFAIVAK
ncbi:MAG: hypothetical protein B7Y12_02180 [Rhizobiales bacterium 24-66-13]|jgi:hypothetical protein|nr:MAG: hypothetical protein B7Z41_03100 [Rhizobiales bacterium 12-66-7]OYY88829.1 MAG: hypothetical protein B7Y61_01210 [Rhizobiales bacterium 35-66-30]OYZ82823.1 MAG: hypothetical protein B7Y12_02180 [Rhizobiales bacterium 24-66-13]OZB11856.1 MAG: hypothetical protein B7X67_02160 [Rhizobiales bacterium 39-66-18]HQS08719.1 hypothetical protein [Xanthobacteraceae bacterium]